MSIVNQSNCVCLNKDLTYLLSSSKAVSVLPTIWAAINVPDNLNTTSSGVSQSLLYSSVGNDILILCTTANLHQLCQAPILFIDGIFESCPALFCQLFTLHAFDQDKLEPLV